MMSELPDVRRRGATSIHAVRIGATREQGGTRSSAVTIGGQTRLPFHHLDGAMPHDPVPAMEISDVPPIDWPSALTAPIVDVMGHPASWADRCVRSFGARLLCLRLAGRDPNGEPRTPAQAAQAAASVLASVDVPLIIWGSGDADLDADLFAAVAEETAGERCLLGTITDSNYRTLTALATAYDHAVIAESPVDINMAKQVNILALDAGFPAERLVIYPTTGALGYGIEYVYSIIERLRIAGLKGDQAVAMPIVADVGREAWSVKEAKASMADAPSWGDAARRGSAWETATAITYLHAGADLLVLRHPDALRATTAAIRRLGEGGSFSSPTLPADRRPPGEGSQDDRAHPPQYGQDAADRRDR